MTTSSEPMLDVFLGPQVPPLLYKKDSQVQIDVMSLAPVDCTITLVLIGKQRIPC
jgi:hypothetical protein